MESSNGNKGTTFVYQRLGWEIRDGGPETDGAPLIVPVGSTERSEPPLVLAAMALRAQLSEEAETAPLKAQSVK